MIKYSIPLGTCEVNLVDALCRHCTEWDNLKFRISDSTFSDYPLYGITVHVICDYIIINDVIVFHYRQCGYPVQMTQDDNSTSHYNVMNTLTGVLVMYACI